MSAPGVHHHLGAAPRLRSPSTSPSPRSAWPGPAPAGPGPAPTRCWPTRPTPPARSESTCPDAASRPSSRSRTTNAPPATQGLPRRTTPLLRQGPLPRPQHRRTSSQQTPRPPRRRHPLRQTRLHLPRHHHRRRHHDLAPRPGHTRITGHALVRCTAQFDRVSFPNGCSMVVCDSGALGCAARCRSVRPARRTREIAACGVKRKACSGRRRCSSRRSRPGASRPGPHRCCLARPAAGDSQTRA